MLIGDGSIETELLSGSDADTGNIHSSHFTKGLMIGISDANNLAQQINQTYSGTDCFSPVAAGMANVNHANNTVACESALEEVNAIGGYSITYDSSVNQ
jgi:S-adenosylmethionine hydrolase